MYSPSRVKANALHNSQRKGKHKMNFRSPFRKITLGAIISVASAGLTLAASNTSFSGDRVTVASDKPFDYVNHAVKSRVGKDGMVSMASVNQGQVLWLR